MNMEMNIGMCELQKVLEYKDWRNFQKVIDKAVLAAIIAFQAKKLWLLKSTSQYELVKEKIENKRAKEILKNKIK